MRLEAEHSFPGAQNAHSLIMPKNRHSCLIVKNGLQHSTPSEIPQLWLWGKHLDGKGINIAPHTRVQRVSISGNLPAMNVQSERSGIAPETPRRTRFGHEVGLMDQAMSAQKKKTTCLHDCTLQQRTLSS
jgi:hypothetical protein